ncbi:hypothetical protein EJ110_NYTH37543 [Nymphaea thermarum]|nr:hypothetical protein EJ110_NYTH37543 [Nymphaea thermarum]
MASFRWLLQLHKDVPKAARFYSKGLGFTVNLWKLPILGTPKMQMPQSSKIVKRRSSPVLEHKTGHHQDHPANGHHVLVELSRI